ncbi:MAG TPA: hypothetical protein VMZ25_06930 [Terriglobales bacterium]|nr:hypothetical protein [Terriglobales bacterium]
MKRSLSGESRLRDEEAIWKSEAGGPSIQGPGDLLAMMVQGGHGLSEEEHDERRGEERAAERPPRKAIISIHGKDVEECDMPAYPRKDRAA